MSAITLTEGSNFQHGKEEYRFISFESTGRVKALHLKTGIRVSLHKSVIEDSQPVMEKA